jgi:hypothetical protein
MDTATRQLLPTLLALALVGCGGAMGDEGSAGLAQAGSALTAAPSGDPGVVAGTASAADVAAPDGTLSLGDLMLGVDANLVLVAASGSMALSGGSVATTSYVVDPTVNDNLVANSASFAQIDAVFTGNAPAALLGSGEIPASALVPGGSQGLVLGTTVLPATVDIIVAHEESGVRSYKVFEVTFDGP